MRHGLKYCLLCNNTGNGMYGIPGTEAIGKYYLPKDKNVLYGWIPVCELCASFLYRDGIQIIPLAGKECHGFFQSVLQDTESQQGGFNHTWEKMLSHGEGLTDIYKCNKCHRQWFRQGDMTSPPLNGCIIGDSTCYSPQPLRCVNPKCRAILMSDRNRLLKPFTRTPDGPRCVECRVRPAG